MDRGAWRATVHGVAKSRTRLSKFTSLHFTSLRLLYNICLRRGFLGEVFFICYLYSSYQCHVGTRWRGSWQTLILFKTMVSAISLTAFYPEAFCHSSQASPTLARSQSQWFVQTDFKLQLSGAVSQERFLGDTRLNWWITTMWWCSILLLTSQGPKGARKARRQNMPTMEDQLQTKKKHEASEGMQMWVIGQKGFAQEADSGNSQ